VKEIKFAQHFANFLIEFHNGKIDQRKFDEFKNKLECDIKYQEKVTELLTVMIDRNVVIEQSKLLAHLFKSHVKGKIDWDRFNTLCIILDKLHPHAYKALYRMGGETNDLSRVYHTTKMANGRKDRRQYFNEDEEALLVSSGLLIQYGTGYYASSLGNDLLKYAIFPLFVENGIYPFDDRDWI